MQAFALLPFTLNSDSSGNTMRPPLVRLHGDNQAINFAIVSCSRNFNMESRASSLHSESSTFDHTAVSATSSRFFSGETFLLFSNIEADTMTDRGPSSTMSGQAGRQDQTGAEPSSSTTPSFLIMCLY